MTKRQRSNKVAKIQHELLAKIREKYPLVEIMQLEEQDNGVFFLHLYAPYEDKIEILEQVSGRVADLVDEGIFLRILPLSHRAVDQAA